MLTKTKTSQKRDYEHGIHNDLFTAWKKMKMKKDLNVSLMTYAEYIE